MIEISYHKQEFWFSCLPACIRMLLEFNAVKIEERQLRKLFKTTIEGGTSWANVVSNIKELDLDFVYLKNQSLHKLKELTEQGTPAVVSLDTRKLGDFAHRNHTVVVIHVNKNYVEIHDPEKGPNIQLDISKFSDAWENRLNRIGYIMKKS